MASKNHFISVARDGRLMARRSGSAPVALATAAEGLSLSVPAEEVARGVPSPLRIFYEYRPHGFNRDVFVLDVEGAGERIDVEEFQRRHQLRDEDLGRWMRLEIERALDGALGRVDG